MMMLVINIGTPRSPALEYADLVDAHLFGGTTIVELTLIMAPCLGGEAVS